MRALGITVGGTRYNISLEEAFADFIVNDLKEAGIDIAVDNDPKDLLKAYLRLAKQLHDYEEEIELLVQELETPKI